MATGLYCFRTAFAIFGFELDPAKAKPPDGMLIALGVLFAIAALQQNYKIVIKPKPGRIAEIRAIIAPLPASNSAE